MRTSSTTSHVIGFMMFLIHPLLLEAFSLGKKSCFVLNGAPVFRVSQRPIPRISDQCQRRITLHQTENADAKADRVKKFNPMNYDPFVQMKMKIKSVLFKSTVITKTGKAAWAIISFPPLLLRTIRARIIHPQASSITDTEKAEQGFTASEFVDISHSNSFLILCGLYVVPFFLITVCAFSFLFERWPIVDSLYYSIVTLTTVGYGDLTPTTPMGKLCAVFLAIYGTSILGLLLGILGQNLVEKQSQAVHAVKERAKLRVLHHFNFLHGTNEKKGKHIEKVIPPLIVNNHITQVSLIRSFKDVLVSMSPTLLILILTGILIGRIEGWSIPCSIYFCIITASTLGYGDYTPKTNTVKIISLFFIPIFVAITGEFIGRIADVVMSRETGKQEQKFLSREFTVEDLVTMDTAGDGQVSFAEFLSFMLVAMHKVDKETIEELSSLFYSLDLNGSGSIMKEDLELMARKNNVTSLS